MAVSARRLLHIALCAGAFGALMGLLKGDDTGLRAGIGNLSAGWVLVGLFAAVHSRNALRGAAIGLISTLTALVGFYASLTVALAGQLGGGGFISELLAEVEANRVYFVFGLLVGPVSGAAGATLGRRGRSSVAACAGVILVLEIAAVALFRDRRLLPRPLYFSWGVDSWSPYVMEAAVGLVVLAATAVEQAARFDLATCRTRARLRHAAVRRDTAASPRRGLGRRSVRPAEVARHSLEHREHGQVLGWIDALDRSSTRRRHQLLH